MAPRWPASRQWSSSSAAETRSSPPNRPSILRPAKPTREASDSSTVIPPPPLLSNAHATQRNATRLLQGGLMAFLIHRAVYSFVPELTTSVAHYEHHVEVSNVVYQVRGFGPYNLPWKSGVLPSTACAYRPPLLCSSMCSTCRSRSATSGSCSIASTPCWPMCPAPPSSM